MKGALEQLTAISVDKESSREQLGQLATLLFDNACISRGMGGGVLTRKRPLGMCRWMGSHFHNWTDYNGVTFLVELLEWGRKFSGFLR